jgi:ribosome-associated protein YbcJ (S4-like RNA binding protein)
MKTDVEEKQIKRREEISTRRGNKLKREKNAHMRGVRKWHV